MQWDQFNKGGGAPLGDLFGGGRPSRRFRRRIDIGFGQWVISGLILVLVLAVMQVNIPVAKDIEEGFRYYLTARDSDWTPVLEAMVQEGVWLDSYDRQVFNSKKPSIGVVAEPAIPTLPVSGQMTRGFGATVSPVDKNPPFHPGIDISAPANSPVRSAAPGTVELVGWQEGLGRVLIISHGGSLQTVYANLSEVLVSQGQQVTQGEVIAKVGNGPEAGSSHLHFAVRDGGVEIDPVLFLQTPQKL